MIILKITIMCNNFDVVRLNSFVTNAKYLGSLILPSPIEVAVTLIVDNDKLEIPELELTLNSDNIAQVKVVKGSELQAQTTMMAGIVGLVIEKDKSYVVIKIMAGIRDASEESIVDARADGVLLKFEEKSAAEEFLEEVENMRNNTIVDEAA
jgi:hypothetical protein